MEDHVCPEALAGVVLHQRRETGHHDRHGDVEQAAMIGKAKGMVPGGRRDHAALALTCVEQEESVAGPPFLERAGALEVLQFAKEAHPRDLRQWDRLGAGRNVHRPGDPFAGGLNVGKGDSGHQRAGAGTTSRNVCDVQRSGEDRSVMLSSIQPYGTSFPI